jgi:hypothetical protein
MLLAKKRLLAAKIETTYGTAISLDATNAVFHVFNPTFSHTIAEVQREGQRGSTKLPSSKGTSMATISFSMEWNLQSAANPMGWTTFMPACAVTKKSATDAYELQLAPPGTSGVKTLSMAVYTDGVVEKLRGAMGTFTISATAGDKFMFNYTFTGVYDGIADTALLAPSYPAISAYEIQRFAASAVTIGGAATPVSNFSFDLGNVVTLVESNAVTEGYLHAIVSDRRPTLTLDPLSATTTSVARQGALLDPSSTVAITVGGTAAQISVPAAQYVQVARGERAGLMTDGLTFLPTGLPGANTEVQFNYQEL